MMSCNFGYKGAYSLFRGLSLNRYILDLNIARNELDDESAEELAQILSNPNCQLRNLDIFDNKIGERGGTLIAKSLLSNRNLRRINLKGNIIKADGGKAFRDCLANSECCTLISLNLNQNPVGVGIENEIDDILFDNQKYNKKNLNVYKSQIVNLKHDRNELEKIQQNIKSSKEKSAHMRIAVTSLEIEK